MEDFFNSEPQLATNHSPFGSVWTAESSASQTNSAERPWRAGFNNVGSGFATPSSPTGDATTSHWKPDYNNIAPGFPQPESSGRVSPWAQPENPVRPSVDMPSIRPGVETPYAVHPGVDTPSIRPGVDTPSLPPRPVPLHPEERKCVEDFFHPRTNLDGFISRNGIIGGTAGFSAWALDKIMEKQSLHNRVSMEWWKSLSPTLNRQFDLTRKVIESTKILDTLNSKITVLEPLVANLAGGVADLRKDIVKRLASPVLGAAERQLLERQAATLATDIHFSQLATNRVIGSAEAVKKGTALFVEGSPEAKLLLDHVKSSSELRVLKTSLAKESAVAGKLQNLLNEHVQEGAGHWFKPTLKGAAIGCLTAGGTLVAGYALDRAIGHDGKVDAAHLIADGFVAPAFLLSSMPAKTKIPLAAASMLLARTADFFNKENSSAIDLHPALRPNWVDGAGMTLVALAPASLPVKLGGALAVAALGRGYNAMAHAFNWDGTAASELPADAENAFNRDQLLKTMESYKNAVAKEKAMGLQTDDAICLKWEDWSKKEKQMNLNEYMRGTAVIFESLGQARLELGSRLDPDNHNVNENRILKSEKIDFGGEAAQDLRRAAGVIVSAQDYANTHPETVSGAGYVAQLSEIQKNIESQLDSIYGAHDIDSVYAQLKSVGYEKLSKAVVRMKGDLGVRSNSSSDARFLAKAARDICLGELVLGAGANASPALKEDALKYLKMSESLDPTAPDNQSLRRIVERSGS